MPLETEVLRDVVGEDGVTRKEALKIWNFGAPPLGGYFPLSAMYTAAIKDSVPDMKGLIAGGDEKTFGDIPDGEFVSFMMSPIYYLVIPGCPLIEKGVQTLKNRYMFRYADDVIVFEPGDVLRAWRSYKS